MASSSNTRVYRKSLLSAFAAATLFLIGCASDGGASKAEAPGVNLQAGMNKAQVTRRCGKPDDVRVTTEGETWIYYLNVGKQLVPWNLGYSPELRLICFNKTGKVKSWKEIK